MALTVELQVPAGDPGVPSEDQFRRWIGAVLDGGGRAREVVVRVVDDGEAAALNRRFRRREGPTNILSFPFDAPPGHPSPLLGDLVICAPLVWREAADQGKDPIAHWAHLAVHGTLHLLGHDHQTEEEAEEMERLERAILGRLGYPDPYQAGSPA